MRGLLWGLRKGSLSAVETKEVQSSVLNPRHLNNDSVCFSTVSCNTLLSIIFESLMLTVKAIKNERGNLQFPES